MTDTIYYILFLFSIVLAMVLGIAGIQTGIESLVWYSILYGVFLPSIYVSATFVRWLKCMDKPSPYILDNVQICPVKTGFIPLRKTIYVFIISLGLMAITSYIVVTILEYLGYVVVIEQRILQLSPIAFFYALILQIPVGTMEEGVFRKAIPEAMAVIAGHPLFFAVSISMLFGLLHLYAYGNIILTSTAISAGVVNSLIYYGVFGREFAGDITALSLAHTFYNVIVMTLAEAPYLIILLFPLLGLIAIIILLHFYFSR